MAGLRREDILREMNLAANTMITVKADIPSEVNYGPSATNFLPSQVTTGHSNIIGEV